MLFTGPSGPFWSRLSFFARQAVSPLPGFAPWRYFCNLLAGTTYVLLALARGGSQCGGARTASACPRTASLDGHGLVSTPATLVSYIFAASGQAAAAIAHCTCSAYILNHPGTDTASRMAHASHDYYSFDPDSSGFYAPHRTTHQGLEHSPPPDLPIYTD